MTDERYSYVEDVKSRKSVARSGGKKGKSRYGCTLPSDSMSHWAKKRENGDVVIMAPDRPILYDDFKELSEDMQRQYLQGIIDNYGGTTERIAKMWGVSEAKVKNHRQLLGIKNPQPSLGALWDIDSGARWTGFLSGIDFLSEPMSYEEFKKLSTNEKKQYLHFLVDDLEASPVEISGLFGIVSQNIRALLKKNGIPPKGREYRYNHKKWEEWLEKYENRDSVMEEENKVTEHIQDSIECKEEPIEYKEEPKIEERSKEIIIHNEIPSMQVHMYVDNQDQIIEMLSKLPKAKKGQIMFVWGKED